MEALEIILYQNKKKISVYDYLRYRSIYEFFINWKEKGMTRKNAAFNAAKKVYDKGLYHVIEKSLEFIRESEGKITPKLYRTFVNNTLFSQMKITASISEKTSRVWLRKLGFIPQSRKKGIYFDGHEHPDKDPILPNGKKLHIFVTHDECLFYANDDCPIIWAPLGEPPLRKKGQGKSIMVSDFLLETIGCLKLTDEQAQVYPNISQEARKFLRSGKNEEEWWWTAKHLLEQVKNNAIPIFEIMHSNAIAIFAFNNSTNHGAMADNALYEDDDSDSEDENESDDDSDSKDEDESDDSFRPAKRQMRNKLFDEERACTTQQPVMKDTIFGPDNKLQSMVFPSNHPKYPNQPKGIKQILIERGLWHNGLRLECELCKGKNKQIDLTRINCCACKIMSLQPDFLA
ncbi:11768_t:CDS:2 [Rhizophagus irregularis]|nr:11768_t:CDS:2 [Rhizophagus irregularis]